jgi:hypothetical protein
MASFGANSAAGAGFQVKGHRFIQFACKKLEQFLSCYLIHRPIL